MGTEVVFVLIYPVALVCTAAAIWFWFAVAKAGQPTAVGYIRGYLPLVAGFAISMAGLALLAYLDCESDFTSLIQQGYYTEPQRPVYLPARVVGQVILDLVFVLPAVCFVVIPLTTKLIKMKRLRWGGVAFRAVVAWGVLSLIGWLLNLSINVPPHPLPDFLKSTAIPVLIYGLPIPIAALLLFPRRLMA
jgi:hypothetical protein